MKKLNLILLVFLISLQSIAQVSYIEGNTFEAKVTGTVRDIIGIPLVGVNIFVKGTAKETATNFDGNFSLDVEEGAILKLSYVGFKTTEVAVENQTIISVTLEEDVELQEIAGSKISAEKTTNKKKLDLGKLAGEILNKVNESVKH